MKTLKIRSSQSCNSIGFSARQNNELINSGMYQYPCIQLFTMKLVQMEYFIRSNIAKFEKSSFKRLLKLQ
jgi:hypothetical protein